MLKNYLLTIATILIATPFLQSQKLILQPTNVAKMNLQKTVSSTQSYSVMGNEYENATSATMNIDSEVKNGTKENFDMTITAKKIKITTAIMGNEIEYDSDKKENPEALKPIDNIVNKPLESKINTNGEIVDINRKDGTGISEELKAILERADLNVSFESFYIKSMLNKEIKEGFTWSDSTEKTGETNIKTVNHYQVTKIENELIYITNNATETMNGPITQMGMKMQMSSSGNIKESIKVSLKTGFITEKESEIKASVSIDANGMTIPVNSNSKSKIVIQQQ